MTRATLCETSINAVLQDLLSEVTVRQVYRNEESVNIEAVYTFPLPLDAVLLDLRVEIGDRVLTGVVVEKSSAEKQYEDAIEAGDAAVMLEALEPGLYTMNVGNLLPKETATITLRYALVYRWVGDELRVLIPTTIAPRFGASPHQPHQTPESSLMVEHQFSLQMDVLGSLRGAQFVCPSHAVTLTTSPDKTVVTLKEPRAAMDRDFVLNVKAPQATRNFAICGADGDGVAAIANFQPMFPGLREPRALDLAIVIDCSGSMQGDSIAQARLAVEGILRALQPHDRVTIVAFGNTTKSFSDRLLPCNHANLAAARQFAADLNADMGGTEIGEALQVAYAATTGSDHADLFVVTDGEVSSWERVVEDARRSGRRVFTVGVGSAVSESFVRGLAAATGGACELVSPKEGMADRVIRHFERLRAPRAKRAVVHWPEGALGLAPVQLGAVFEGDTVMASAQFSRAAVIGSVCLEIETVSGEVFRQEVALALAALPVESVDSVSTVARLAASARLSEPSSAAPAQTAVRYQLISPWTNWLVVAERAESQKALDIPAIRKVPQTMAAGWGGTGSVVARYMMHAPDINFCLAAPAPAREKSAPRDHRPESFRLLLDLIDSDPSRLEPRRALELLNEAGLLSEYDDLLQRGGRLGLEPTAIAVMILAVLIEGPLRQFLAHAEQGAFIFVREYANRIRAMLDDVTGRSHELLQVIERTDGLRVLDPRFAHEARDWVMRLNESRKFFAEVEDVVRGLSSRVADTRKSGPQDRRKR